MGQKQDLTRKTQDVQFLLSVAEVNHIPPVKSVEIAFLGGSNVGKSSIINALFNRKNLARSSKFPGRTQLLNFFLWPPHITFVDVPGYGFANAPSHVRKTWESLMLGYLASRAGQLKVYLLMDCRKGIKPIDFEIMTLLQQYRLFYRLVITKVDKLNVTETLQLEKDLKARFQETFLLTSAKTKLGIDILKKNIVAYAQEKMHGNGVENKGALSHGSLV